MTALSPLLDGVVFLAQYFGTAVERDALAGAAQEGHASASDRLARCCARAGLVASPLEAGSVRAAMLPAMVLGRDGAVLVVLQRDGDGFECHLPGVAGTRWLDGPALQRECPDPSWHAVRPALFFDQRSLLYSLPSARRWFWDVFGRNRWILQWALLGTLALNLFGTLIPFFSMAVYDRVVPNNAIDSLWVLTLAAILLIAFEFAMKLLRGALIESAAKRMDIALSASIFAQCLRLRATSRPASGGVLANVVRDFESVRDFFASGTMAVLGDLPFLLLFLALIGLIGGWLVLVPLVAIPVMLLLAFGLQRPLARYVAASTQHSAQRTAHLFETMNALDTVKALGAEAWSRRKWEQLTVSISDLSLKTREAAAFATHLSAMLIVLTNVLLVAVGAFLIGEQALTVGQLIGVTLLSGRAMAPVAQIAGLIVRWQKTRLAMHGIDRIMAAATDDAATVLHAPPLTGRIEFRDVHFGYPQRNPLLAHFNLRIEPGERVGFIGKLGSGKSTVLKLLLNLHAPVSGSVLVDDLVSTQLDPLSLRRQIGYVPQDVTLFHGSVRENIELGRTHGGEAALLSAIRTACLDETLNQLPGGVSTEVGERGELLSGGQRQTIALARALLNRPPVLLLDEPSSMMDPATEQRLIAQLRALEGTTLLLVTHRMAMLPLVDRLVVMDRGRVVADGPRDQVLRSLAQGAPVSAPLAPPAPAAPSSARLQPSPATAAAGA